MGLIKSFTSSIRKSNKSLGDTIRLFTVVIVKKKGIVDGIIIKTGRIVVPNSTKVSIKIISSSHLIKAICPTHILYYMLVT